MKYSIRLIGSTPYSTKVMAAPSKVPLLLVASAAAIMTATYSHAIGMMYMRVLLVLSAWCGASAVILRLFRANLVCEVIR